MTRFPHTRPHPPHCTLRSLPSNVGVRQEIDMFDLGVRELPNPKSETAVSKKKPKYGTVGAKPLPLFTVQYNMNKGTFAVRIRCRLRSVLLLLTQWSSTILLKDNFYLHTYSCVIMLFLLPCQEGCRYLYFGQVEVALLLLNTKDHKWSNLDYPIVLILSSLKQFK